MEENHLTKPTDDDYEKVIGHGIYYEKNELFEDEE